MKCYRTKSYAECCSSNKGSFLVFGNNAIDIAVFFILRLGKHCSTFTRFLNKYVLLWTHLLNLVNR